MKKSFVFILAFVYLFVSSGIAINTHYCMGKVESVNIFEHSDDKCGKCGMPANNDGCCKDEFSMLKLQDCHKQSESLVHVYAPQCIMPACNNYLVNVDVKEQVSFINIFRSPPPSNYPALCILNCVFRC